MIEVLSSEAVQVKPALGAKPEPVVESAAMRKVIAFADKVAQADISVFISGESGTGKEVLARYIHRQSLRSDGPFVAMNCAAVPESMLEATLFGHEKGAFTGAQERRIGKFEQANHGTLLLDEITEMPVGLQAKLLRVIQEREVERLGSSHAKPIDVRILATSNRDLHEAVEEGVLREDLYYRLSVFPLEIPPLRDRTEDVIPLFASHLAANGKPHLALSPDARNLILSYEWPGNVRELENCVQRALVLCDGEVVTGEMLGISGRKLTQQRPTSLHAVLKSNEDDILLDTLAKNGGVRKHTAIELGISERTLRHKLQLMREKGILVERSSGGRI